MVESLKELNTICQKPRYKLVGNWMVRHVIRDAALPITWLLLHTNVSANQVTLASLIVGLIGISMFALPASWFLFVGVLLLQLWYLLDHVDGQIARYRKTASLSGRFFDFITHHIIHGAFFFSVSYYCFSESGLIIFLLWGFIVSLSMILFNVATDTKYQTFYEHISTLKGVTVKSVDGREKFRSENDDKRVFRQVFSILRKASEIHVLMNIFTVSAVIETFLIPQMNTRFILFLLYGTWIPIMSGVELYRLIAKRKIDESFASQFEEIS